MTAIKPQKPPPSRRIQIKLAALDCFLANGYVATTIADIRTRSGATTGSIYHFFENKGALAFELFSDALADWSDETARAETGPAPEERLRASITGLLRWGVASPNWFRFLDEVRALAQSHAELAQCAQMLANVHAEAAAWYDELARNGRVLVLPWSMAHALMLGPAYDYLRTVAGGIDDAEAERAIVTLVDAAWKSVRVNA